MFRIRWFLSRGYFRGDNCSGIIGSWVSVCLQESRIPDRESNWCSGFVDSWAEVTFAAIIAQEWSILEYQLPSWPSWGNRLLEMIEKVTCVQESLIPDRESNWCSGFMDSWSQVTFAAFLIEKVTGVQDSLIPDHRLLSRRSWSRK